MGWFQTTPPWLVPGLVYYSVYNVRYIAAITAPWLKGHAYIPFMLMEHSLRIRSSWLRHDCDASGLPASTPVKGMRIELPLSLHLERWCMCKSKLSVCLKGVHICRHVAFSFRPKKVRHREQSPVFSCSSHILPSEIVQRCTVNQ